MTARIGPFGGGSTGASNTSSSTTIFDAEKGTTTAAPTSAVGIAAAAGNLLRYDESVNCGTRAYQGEIVKLEALDPSTVKLVLCTPDPAIPAKVALRRSADPASEYIDKAGGTKRGDLVNKPIGIGPYMLAQWDKGSQNVLKANPYYWGGKPVAKTVFQWNGEPAQRLAQLQSGEADGIDNVGTADFDTVANDPNLQLVERQPLNVFYVGFQCRRSAVQHEKLRQATGYAIDKQRIVDNFYPKGLTRR